MSAEYFYAIAAARNIITHGKIVQVDGGDYGVNPPTNVWHPKDTRFGSIDKTNMFGSHADMRSLVEETWIWDDRHGLPKPERYSKVIAHNLSRLLAETAKIQIQKQNRMLTLNEEKIAALYRIRHSSDGGVEDKVMHSKLLICGKPYDLLRFIWSCTRKLVYCIPIEPKSTGG